MGYFYAIQIAPELAPGRTKLGYTANPSRRLWAHLTVAPTARYIGLWPCERRDERGAIAAIVRALNPVIVGPEVFDFSVVGDVVDVGDKHFGCDHREFLGMAEVEVHTERAAEPNGPSLKTATDRLLNVMTHAELAERLGCSVASIRQARLDKKAKAARSDPPRWQTVVAAIAEERGDELKELARELKES